ncbi:TRAP transporter substrate-binding protein DctP [Pseudomarimonas salicorniae]|uniref:TRAP transporter substrate-binding protein DctP n=1 Tax=Pseudomarimonas salicorniae TaxID=2933270 RepID=A0ABT0GEK6_9GAMM|nr:TRAP transporter substrate-binding protein DctP [Lysobacter sp. CAU 1642]MCK7592984.1 TRAP transporter substrate-binding protein DctP [Lysobacter sp. CAU 1642]
MSFSSRALLLGLALCCSLQAAAATLKIATLAPEGSAWMTAMRQAAKEAEQASEGRVKIKFYPGGVMGNDSTVMKKIRLGQLQGGALTATELASVAPNAPIYGLPFLFDDEDEVQAARQALDAKLAAELKDKGFRLLSLSGVGFAYLMSAADISHSKALEARKVWVPQGDLIAELTFRKGGISPLPLPLADVFTALQSGLIDTVGNTPAGAIALQWHNGLRQILDLPLSYVTGFLVVQERAFGKLSEADQQAVVAAFRRAGERLDASNREADTQAMQALLELGVKRIEASPEEVERWRRIGREVGDQLVAEGRLDAGMLAELRRVVDTQRR